MNLPLHHLLGGTSNRLTTLNARLKVEDGLNVVFKFVTEVFVIRNSQVIQLTLARLSQGDRPSRDVMGFTEWDLNNKRRGSVMIVPMLSLVLILTPFRTR